MKNAPILPQQAIEMLLKHWSKYAKIKKSHFNWLLNNSIYHQLSTRGVLDEAVSRHSCAKEYFKSTLALRIT